MGPPGIASCVVDTGNDVRGRDVRIKARCRFEPSKQAHAPGERHATTTRAQNTVGELVNRGQGKKVLCYEWQGREARWSTVGYLGLLVDFELEMMLSSVGTGREMMNREIGPC